MDRTDDTRLSASSTPRPYPDYDHYVVGVVVSGGNDDRERARIAQGCCSTASRSTLNDDDCSQK